MIAFLATTLVSLITAVYVSWRYWKASYRLQFVPSGRDFPWIGTPINTQEFYKEICDYFERFPYRFKIWNGPLPSVCTGEVEDVADIVRSNALNDRSHLFRKLLAPWLGDSVLLSNGQHWRDRRKLLMPAFHFGILKEYAQVFEKYAQKLTDDVWLVTKQGRQSVDVQPLMSKWAFFVINETAMGVKLDEGKDSQRYSDALQVVKSKFLERWTKSWLLPNFIFKISSSGRAFFANLEIMNNFVVKVINKRIEERKTMRNNTGKKYRSFLDIMLDAHEAGQIDAKGLLNEVNMFMFAGHDTTSCALGWSLYQLGRNMDVQEKLHAAVKERMSQPCDDLFEKYGNIEYLEMVIKEILRTKSPVVIFHRTVAEEGEIIGGNAYPKGVEFNICVDALHTNKKFWKDPQVFNPERFSSNGSSDDSRHVYQFTPFSAGKRNCIGQRFAMWELRIFLCHLLLNYRVTTPPQTTHVQLELVRVSSNGIWIEFERRL